MNTNQTDMNEAFEAWFLGGDTKLILNKSKEGHYVYATAHSAWQVWQASTKASEQRIQELEALLAKQLNAIEHAEYLAESAERLLAYLNDVTDEEECVIRPDDRYGDHAGSIRNYVYEFRKRAQRARVEK